MSRKQHSPRKPAERVRRAIGGGDVAQVWDLADFVLRGLDEAHRLLREAESIEVGLSAAATAALDLDGEARTEAERVLDQRYRASRKFREIAEKMRGEYKEAIQLAFDEAVRARATADKATEKRRAEGDRTHVYFEQALAAAQAFASPNEKITSTMILDRWPQSAEKALDVRAVQKKLKEWREGTS